MILTLVLASTDAAPTASPLGSLIPFALIGGLFYFLLIRPQRKRQAEQQSMLRRIGVGDEIVTIGGFYGTVTELDDDTMVVTLAPGVDVRMARTAVSRPIGEPTGGGLLDDLDDDDFDDDDYDLDDFEDEGGVMEDIARLDGSHDALDDDPDAGTDGGAAGDDTR